MAGGISLGSQFLNFLSSRGLDTSGRTSLNRLSTASTKITTGGTSAQNVMKSTQARSHIQEAIAAYDADATNNIYGQETNFQKTESTVQTTIDSGSNLETGVATGDVEYVDLGNESIADVDSEQDIDIAQIGSSEDGANATNNAYFIEDNTQLANSDNGLEATDPSVPTDPSSYLLSWFASVQNASDDPTGGVNLNREEPVFTFAAATTELDPVDTEALASLLRTVGKAASTESRVAARAIYALARLVGNGDDDSRLYRNAKRLEEALEPMDPNVGYDYNAEDATVFANAMQYVVNILPNFVVDDPELVNEIQCALVDITNSLSVGGVNTIV
jgi:hypothetical protein